MITLTGADLTPSQLVDFADSGEFVAIDPAARERAQASRATLLEILGRRPVYGRSTGVGANHSVALGASDHGAGRRLLHSHAGGAGALMNARAARATMVVRANQLLTGAAGAGYHNNVTGNSGGAVKTQNGDVYAGHDGNVYQHSDSGWSKYNNGSWNQVQRPSGSTSTAAAPPKNRLRRRQRTTS